MHHPLLQRPSEKELAALKDHEDKLAAMNTQLLAASDEEVRLRNEMNNAVAKLDHLRGQRRLLVEQLDMARSRMVDPQLPEALDWAIHHASELPAERIVVIREDGRRIGILSGKGNQRRRMDVVYRQTSGGFSGALARAAAAKDPVRAQWTLGYAHPLARRISADQWNHDLHTWFEVEIPLPTTPRKTPE